MGINGGAGHAGADAAAADAAAAVGEGSEDGGGDATRVRVASVWLPVDAAAEEARKPCTQRCMFGQ